MSRVLICIPTKPTLCPALKLKAHELSARLPDANPDHDITIMHDYRKIESLPTDYTPWSKVTRARQLLLDTIDCFKFDYLLWIDADVVEYPADMPSRLIKANPKGIAAPMVFIEGQPTRLYDWAGFVQSGRDHIEPTNRWNIIGRNLQHEPPHWDKEPEGRIVPMDVVGTVVLVHSDIVIGHQFHDAPAMTDWLTLCQKARKIYGSSGVVVDRDCVAMHADLGSGKYEGEVWH